MLGFEPHGPSTIAQRVQCCVLYLALAPVAQCRELRHRRFVGGQIWVESELGKGSCFGFSLTLPRAEDSEPLAALPILLHRVLVADDQLVNRTILDRQLVAQGLDVTLCASGAEAFEALSTHAPGYFDLLLTDHEMPGMSGLDLTAKLRAAGHTLPVILLSSAPTVVRDHPATSDLRAILQKPLLRHDLVRHLQALSNPQAEPRPRPLPAPAVVGSGSGRRMRLLTAEDNRTNRLVFSKMVADLAVDIRFAEDGAQAVEAFRAQRPDLIFMDISMPGMDGRTATRAIRQLPGGAQVPIIALTAHAMPSDQDDILAAGMDHVLTKPLKKPLLIDMIARYRPDETCPLETRLDDTG